MNLIQIIIALFGAIAPPLLLAWALVAGSRETYRDFIRWRRAVRRSRRQPTGAGIGVAG